MIINACIFRASLDRIGSSLYLPDFSEGRVVTESSAGMMNAIVHGRDSVISNTHLDHAGDCRGFVHSIGRITATTFTKVCFSSCLACSCSNGSTRNLMTAG